MQPSATRVADHYSFKQPPFRGTNCSRSVSRFVLVVAVLAACAPKQPLQASYFTAPPDPDAPASCSDTLACYRRCAPLTEECMLLCDRESHPRQVELARAVHHCSARHGCTDQACTDELCAPELRACTAPAVAPAPSP